MICIGRKSLFLLVSQVDCPGVRLKVFWRKGCLSFAAVLVSSSSHSFLRDRNHDSSQVVAQSVHPQLNVIYSVSQARNRT